MLDSSPYTPPTTLKIEECSVILEMIRTNPCEWNWPGLVSLFERLERLIEQLGSEFHGCPACNVQAAAAAGEFEAYRRGEEIRQQANGDLVCNRCGRVVAPAEGPRDVG
jgi:hypothetical protein